MARKEQIIEQAAQMFAQLGIKSVRMDDIASELNISKRTLYEMFGDKEELLFHSIMFLFERRRMKHALVMQTAKNELEAIFKILTEIRQDAPISTRLDNNLRKFYPKVHERLRLEGEELNSQGLTLVLQRGIERGIFRPEISCELLVNIFYGLGQAIKSTTLIKIPESMSEEEAFMQIATTLFRGIATNEGIEIIDRYQREYIRLNRAIN